MGCHCYWDLFGEGTGEVMQLFKWGRNVWGKLEHDLWDLGYRV